MFRKQPDEKSDRRERAEVTRNLTSAKAQSRTNLMSRTTVMGRKNNVCGNKRRAFAREDFFQPFTREEPFLLCFSNFNEREGKPRWSLGETGGENERISIILLKNLPRSTTVSHPKDTLHISEYSQNVECPVLRPSSRQSFSEIPRPIGRARATSSDSTTRDTTAVRNRHFHRRVQRRSLPATKHKPVDDQSGEKQKDRINNCPRGRFEVLPR